ncbi:class I adenylate-forming enzyme family protein [Chloroflexota bacterium]
MLNLKLMLETVAGQHPQKTAIISGEQKLTYAELDTAANKVANALLKIGVRRGDRVAILLTNSPEFVATYFGAIKAGSIPIPLDIRYKAGELAPIFDNCRPKVLVAESLLLEPLISALPGFDFIEHVIELDSQYEGQFLSYREITAAGSPQAVDLSLDPEDIATISYGGGPSNHPRGAALSHSGLLTEAIVAGDGFQQTGEDIMMLFALPMYHMFGLGSVLLPTLYRGGTVVVVPGTGRSISSLLEAIEKEKGTIWLGVPYIFSLAINVARREGIKSDLSSLRLCVSAGATLSVELIRQFKQSYGFTLVDVWGLTESVSHITCPPIDGTWEPGSTGKALPGWEIKAVDDAGKDLPVNQPGEIVVRGPMMKGFFNNPQTTAEVIRDGWLYTGDLGRVDADGYLFLTGRKKNMIILKGQNIYPGDIEEVLSTHSKMAKAVVVGIPDSLRGETVAAAILLKEGETATEQEIRRFCQERMSDYKVPKHIIFTNSLSDYDTSKIDKESLQKQILPLFSPESPPH